MQPLLKANGMGKWLRAAAIDKLCQHLKDADNSKFDCAFFKNSIGSAGASHIFFLITFSYLVSHISGSAGSTIMELLISNVYSTIETGTHQKERRHVVCFYLSSTDTSLTHRTANNWLHSNGGRAKTWKDQFDAMDAQQVNFEFQVNCPTPKRKRSDSLEEFLGGLAAPSPPPSPPPSSSSSE
jgi:hypothetical protein